MKNYGSLVDALTDLKQRGYEANFETQSNCLYCGDLDMRLDPDDFHVDEIYRFEENTYTEKPVLYAISSSTGVKGVLIDTTGEYNGNPVSEKDQPSANTPINNDNAEQNNRYQLETKDYESLVDALADLKKRGYKAAFEIEPTCLYCGVLHLRLEPEAFKVDEVYRFEENSSPDDSSILYAISSLAGVKGTLVDAYGVYAENMSFEMAQKLRMQVRGAAPLF
jgi:hypothetical protein